MRNQSLYDDFKIDMECLKCPPGHYIEKGIALSNFEHFPFEYNFTTSC